MLKSSIERYVLWLAPALVVQAVTKLVNGGPALQFLEEPAKLLILSPADVITIVSLGYFLPNIVTAIWIFRDSKASLPVRFAWSVSALFLTFFVLVPYVGSLLLAEKKGEPVESAP